MKADFKSRLELLEEQLKQAVSGQSANDSIHVHRVADPADLTQEAVDRDLAVEMLDRESALVRHLRSAIGRIKDGSYGLCLECEEEIAPARLKALPWAQLCIRCQERAEGLPNPAKRLLALEYEAEAA